MNALVAIQRDTRNTTRGRGEPLSPQRLVMDFSPQASAEDSGVLQDKCSAFWKFIDTRPEFDDLKTDPVSGQTYYYLEIK
ncbi:unnamed protein product [Leptidea sinapis]|uniref:Uncharacterized protein n=1 Tax=Leptidea sinapis TaxID=189913 RepID=A0A5E4R7I3_9NEOP|nr:unnamed protein product [Leptidea sinapis]